MPPGRSSSSTNINRLSIIAEDGPSEPNARGRSARASHRPFDRRWRDDPPRPSFEASPPEYMLGDIGKSKADALRRLRSNKQVARRGGWRRLVVILVIVLLLLIALGVGLGVGLSRNRSSGSSSSSPSASSTPQAFPAGAYAISTYLTTVQTDCTAQSSTWRCFPYTTYSPSSASAALVTFNWLINATTSSPTATTSSAAPPFSSPATYVISSSDNPFAITFSNVSLDLVDAGRPSERYTFSLPIDKYVPPAAPITSDNTPAACWFNATRFEGSLYTRRQTNASASESAPAPTPTATNGWQPWPGAVNVTQSIAGGENVPNCYQLVNGVMGAPVTQGLEPKPAADVCECGWRNFGL